MPRVECRPDTADFARQLTPALLASAAALTSLLIAPQWGIAFGFVAVLTGVLQPYTRVLWLLCFLVCAHTVWKMESRAESRIADRAVLDNHRVRVEQISPSVPPQVILRDWQSQQRYRVGLWGEHPALYVGQCLRANLRLRPPVASRNFHGFDYGRWLYLEAIDATGSLKFARDCPASEYAAKEDSPPVVSEAPLWEALGSSPGRALMHALLLADRSAFTAAIWDVLSRTGTSHLFAISGLHVGLVAMMSGAIGYALWWFAVPLQTRGPRRKTVLIASIIGVLLYMGIAAEQVSAQRAGLMAIAGLGLVMLGRRVPLPQIWSLALLLVLTGDPFSVLSPATVLSFAACLLLMVLTPVLRAKSFLWQLCLVQLALGWGLASLTAAFFGHVSLVGLALNMVLVPALSIFLPASLIALVVAKLGWLEPLRWGVALLDSTFQMLEWLAQADWALWVMPAIGFVEAGVAFLVVVWGIAQSRPRNIALAVALWWGVIGVVLITRQDVPTGHARLWMLDVGQGQAVVIQTAQHWVVVDPGPRSPRGRFDAGAMVVAPHLAAFGAERVDLLIVSHGDSDHSGGLEGLAEHMLIDEIWGDGGQDCERGLRWGADGVAIRSVPVGVMPAWGDNDRSCVILVEVAHRKVLLAGDIEAPAERALLASWPAEQPVDVIAIPHHGSQSSSTLEFVRAMSPKIALVSAGRFNRWNFPRELVVDRWRSVGTLVLSTSGSGAVRLGLPEMSLERPVRRPWHVVMSPFEGS